MPSAHGHKHSDSVSQNRKAQLANAYNELGKELSSTKIRVVGNYTLGKVIGEGAYGKVRLGTHRLTSTRVAIKQIPKAMSASLTREIHHHRQLHHPHVTQMYEVIATETSIWIVTELCSGGELFDYLAEKGRLPEDETRILFGQLCLAVAYLHENGIVHRDLKLENVLLDERCRVKLGDFGFTREYERGSFMETFCGTTGYASPEMLQGRKYQGPEVDVWSLGVILYCLLTGTLPFDDDDEDVMRQKVIHDDFEDPAWLSLESRDLLQNILQKDVSKRYTIPQILAHPWFTVKELSYEPDSPLSPDHLQIPRSSSPETSEASTQDHTSNEPESSTPTTPDDSVTDPFDSTPHPDDKTFSIHRNPSNLTIRRTSLSDIESLSSRLTKQQRETDTVFEEEGDSSSSLAPESSAKSARLRPVSWSNSASSTKVPPPSSMIRTPARTKRRSVSSVLSENILGPDFENNSKTPAPVPEAHLDFSSLLTTPTPIIFSTPLERELLNTLSNMGMDTAQIVHSVLSDACDSAGALWWMLKKKALEKRAAEAELGGSLATDTVSTPITDSAPVPRARRSTSLEGESTSGRGSPRRKRTKASTGVQTDDQGTYYTSRVAPQLAFVPPTPTFVSNRPTTPPPQTSPGSRSPMLSPTSSVVNVELQASLRSHPSTPGGSTGSGKDKEGKSRKNRAGSVSIMQRATTALEAAGLVRKKSAEAVLKEKEEKALAKEQREREKESARERERDRGDPERRGTTSGEESRSSHSHHSHITSESGAGKQGGNILSGSGAAKLTKSPPAHKTQLKEKEREYVVPSTPPPPQAISHSEPGAGAPAAIGSPWVLADREGMASLAMGSGPSSVAALRGEMVHSHSAPNLETLDHSGANSATATPTSARTGGGKGAGGNLRNRANILTSLRLWFNDDKKGKRKADAGAGPASAGAPQRTPATPQTGYSTRSMGMGFGTAKRRGSNSSTKFAAGRGAGGGAGHRAKRPSMSSRRSSSVNSRRSSVASMQMVAGGAVSAGVMDSPSNGMRGTHTPTSDGAERGLEGLSSAASRPSSIHSFSMLSSSAGGTKQQHRKSPSASSSGSLHLRTASPLQRHHRRAGSASSGGTRVVRQNVASGVSVRPPHARSNSATSSLYSPPSSRPTSFYEPSDGEGLSSSYGAGNGGNGSGRNASPMRSRKRSSGERRGGTTTTFVAQKRSGPLASPAFGNGSSTLGKSSWKKAWGMEPPGWSSRSTLVVPAVEVLAMGPVNSSDPPILRDVFSGRSSFSQSGHGSGGGDESDWVDEDDLDIPAFAGGLGQMGVGVGGAPAFGSGVGGSSSGFGNLEPIVTLSPAPRGWGGVGKRGAGGGGAAGSGLGGGSVGGGGGGGSAGARSKPGQSPAERHSPLPPDSGSGAMSTGRRQLPTARSGPAFKHAIQEEDEDEEEE